MKNNENIWIFADAFPYENHFHTDAYCTPSAPRENEQVFGSPTSFVPWHGQQLGRAPTQVRASSVGVPVPKDSEIEQMGWGWDNVKQQMLKKHPSR